MKYFLQCVAFFSKPISPKTSVIPSNMASVRSATGIISIAVLAMLFLTCEKAPKPTLKVRSYFVGSQQVTKASNGIIANMQTTYDIPQITITFNTVLLPESVSSTDFSLTRTTGENTVNLSARLTNQNKVIIVKPLSKLSRGTTYRFSASSKIKNSKGITIASTDVYRFNIEVLATAEAPDVHPAPTVDGVPTANSITLNIPAFSGFGKNAKGQPLPSGTRRLQQRQDASGQWTPLTVALPDNKATGKITVNGLSPNTAYFFRIIVANDNSDPTTKTKMGEISTAIKTSSGAEAPDVHPAPTVDGTPKMDSITLNIPAFSGFGKNAQGQPFPSGTRKLQQRQGASGQWTPLTLTLPGNAATGKVTVNNLTPNTEYFFRIIVANDNSDPTTKTKMGEISTAIKTGSGTEAPGTHPAPTVDGTPKMDSITLNIPAFSRFGKNAQGQPFTSGTRKLQQRQGANGQWTPLTLTLPGNAATGKVTVTGLTPNTEYFFRIVVSNSNPTRNTTEGTPSTVITTSSTTQGVAAPDVHPAPTEDGTPTTNSITLNIPAFSGFGKDAKGENITTGTRKLQQRQGANGQWTPLTVALPGNAATGKVTVSNLTPNTEYFFRIVVSNRNTTRNTTEGTPSASIQTATAFAVPDVHPAPTEDGTPTTNSITLNIPAFSGFGKNTKGENITTGTRKLQQRQGANGQWTPLTVTLPGNAATGKVTVSNLTPNTEYFFRIVVSNGNPTNNTTTGTPSTGITTSATSQGVAAPNVHPAPTEDGTPTTNSITLNIPAFSGFGKNAKGENITTGTRKLQQRQGANGQWTPLTVALTGNAATGKVTVTGLTPNTEYFFRIVVSNSNPTNNTTTGTPSTGITTSAPSQGVAAPGKHPAPTGDGTPKMDSITLNIPAFSRFGKNAQGQRFLSGTRTLQRREGTNGQWTTLSTLTLPDNKAAGKVTVTGLNPNTEYFFRIVVSNGNADINFKTTIGEVSGTIRTTVAITGNAKAPGMPAVVLSPFTKNNIKHIETHITPPSIAGNNPDGTTATITSYLVEYAENENFSPILRSRTLNPMATLFGGSKDTLALPDLGNEKTTYHVRVSAQNNVGLSSGFSLQRIGLANNKAYPTLPDFQAVKIGGNSVRVTLTTTRENNTTYNLHYANNPLFVDPVYLVKSFETSSSLTITGLGANQTWYFKVFAAIDDGGEKISRATDPKSVVLPSLAKAPDVHAPPTIGGWSGNTLLVVVPPFGGSYGKAPDGNNIATNTGTRTLEIREGENGEWRTAPGRSLEPTDKKSQSQRIPNLKSGVTYYLRIKLMNNNTDTGSNQSFSKLLTVSPQ